MDSEIGKDRNCNAKGLGGNGVYSAQSKVTIFSASVTGGNGGTSTGYMGSGGGGGDGVIANGAAVVIGRGTVTGGTGAVSDSGSGGSAGDAVAILAQGSVALNGGTLTGGNGGNSSTGAGGAGRYGVVVNTGTVTINSGSVTGGNGGTGFTAGVGGEGVAGADVTLITNGVITGGMSGNMVQADSVTFSGTNNVLAIGSNAVFKGAVDSQTGILTFNQSAGSGFSANATLTANLIGAAPVVKAGTGTLTLAGAADTYSGGTTIQSGVLDLAALGAAAQARSPSARRTAPRQPWRWLPLRSRLRTALSPAR